MLIFFVEFFSELFYFFKAAYLFYMFYDCYHGYLEVFPHAFCHPGFDSLQVCIHLDETQLASSLDQLVWFHYQFLHGVKRNCVLNKTMLFRESASLVCYLLHIYHYSS